MTYKDDKGYTYSAHRGLGETGWFVMKQKDGCEGWHRVKSPALPERENEKEAQDDLDAWAIKKGLKPVESQEPKVESREPAEEPEPVNNVWQAELIDIRTIRPSPVNRKGMTENDPETQELAKSIEKSGLLQPITVRRVEPDDRDIIYELVCGERRWLAFWILANEKPGWMKIPAYVRELDDQTAHELTAIENLQRVNLTPFQEAMNLGVLLDSGRDIEEIADRLGKPVGWVVRRAKLRDLTPKWKAAIADPACGFSYWPATHLELVARHASEVQDEIYALFNPSYIKAVSLAELRKELGRFMLTLSSAPWPKDAEWPGLKNPTPCDRCTLRSSYQPLLFDDIPGHKTNDRCLDKKCYSVRLEAYIITQEKALRRDHPGLLLVNRADWQKELLPGDSSLKKRKVEEQWRYETVKTPDEHTVPALIIDGPGVGGVEYWRLKKEYRDRGAQDPQFDASGNKLPKPLKERRAALAKRREMRLLERTYAILEEEAENRERCADLTVEQMLAAAVMYRTEGMTYAGTTHRCLTDGERYKYVLSGHPEGNPGIRDLTEDLFNQVERTWMGLVKQAGMYGETSSGWPEFIYALFNLDLDAAKAEIEKEIPEPKGWAGLNEDGTPKKGAKGAA